MQNIWFTADNHWGHKNMISGISTWENKEDCRQFNTLEEHNSTIEDGINKYCRENDIIYNIGDWAFGGAKNIWKFRKQLFCKNIHIVLGNHDHHIRKNKILSFGDYVIPVQSLFSSVNILLEKKICGQNFVLCHNAMRTWNNGSRGSIMLYGHSHGSLAEYQDLSSKEYFRTTDVGIDVAFAKLGEYRPFHFDEILLMMKERINLSVDSKRHNT